MSISLKPGYDYGFYNGYIGYADNTDLITALEASWADIRNIFSQLTDEQLELRYEPGKWSVKEILQHLVDAEHIYCYRTLRISRGDQVELPPIDMNMFIGNAHVEKRSAQSMLAELELLRKASILMFKDMPSELLERTGPVRGVTIPVKAIGFAQAGHCMHHMKIIKERYLRQLATSEHPVS